MKPLVSGILVVLLFSPIAVWGLGADTAKQIFESATQALNAGDYPAAEAGFNQVLKLDPRNVSALANLGVLYAKTHRYGKAIDVYQRALRIALSCARFSSILASPISNRKITSMRCHISGNCTSDHLPTIRPPMLLATCLTFSGHPDQGLGLLKPLTEADNPDPAALYLLGVAYARAGQAQQAQQVFSKLLPTAPLRRKPISCWATPITTERNLLKRSRPTRQCCKPILHFPGLIASSARYTSA